MALEVAAVDEPKQFRTRKPAVHQQVVEAESLHNSPAEHLDGIGNLGLMISETTNEASLTALSAAGDAYFLPKQQALAIIASSTVAFPAGHPWQGAFI